LDEGYAKTSAAAVKGDFVYFDPPYDPISKTSNFTSYTKDAFDGDAQKALATHALVLAKRGVNVMLSNNDTPYIRSLYADFCIDTVQCGRSINSKGDKRGKVDEVIITSYPASN
jgi:DNA adenine methylase